jgi:hypothetical protein
MSDIGQIDGGSRVRICLLSVYMLGTLVSYAFFEFFWMFFFLGIGVIIVAKYYKVGLLRDLGKGWYGVVGIGSVFILIILAPIAVHKSIGALYFILSSIVGILIAYTANKLEHELSISLRIVLCFIQLGMLVYILFRYPEDLFPLESILQGRASSNVATSFLIVLQACYACIAFVKFNKIAWATSLVTLFICILGHGRGSMLAALFILVLLILLGFINHRLSFGRLSVLLAVFVLQFLFLWIFGDDLYVLLIENTKLGSGFVDESRLLMISEYLNGINSLPLLIGASYSGTVIESMYDGNPHNSFIRAHYMMGVFYLIGIIFIVSTPVFTSLFSVRSVAYCGFVFVILFRAFSEPLLFPGPIDFTFFMVVFSSIVRAGENRAKGSF